MEYVTHVVAAVVGVLFSCWRLKGCISMKDSLKMVIQGGGGPGEELKP